MKNKKLLVAILVGAILAGGMTACSKAEIIEPNSENDFSIELVSTGFDTTDLFNERDISGKTDENYVTVNLDAEAQGEYKITEEGTYEFSGSAKEFQILVDATKDDKVQIVLNNVSIENTVKSPINVLQAKKVFVTSSGESNSLSITDTVKTTDCAVIYSKDDLVLNGAGALSLSSVGNNGIICNDDLKICFSEAESNISNLNINAGMHGIKTNDSILINSGSINIKCAKDGLHCDNDEEDKGHIYIASANMTINSSDDGIHASDFILIDNGNITVENSNEGIEAQQIEINGGEISVTSSDDGLNASAGSNSQEVQKASEEPFEKRNMGGFGNMDTDESCYIAIGGGSLTVNAQGDGIDSNGYIQQTGGSIIVFGPEDNGNGALDYGIGARITGGEIVALGMSGMAENFSYAEQCSILAVFDNAESGELTVKSGLKEILNISSDKKYDSVLYSSSELEIGKSYSFNAGSSKLNIKADDYCYSNKAQGSFMPGVQKGNDNMNKEEFGPREQDGGEPPERPDGDMPKGDIPNQNKDLPAPPNQNQQA